MPVLDGIQAAKRILQQADSSTSTLPSPPPSLSSLPSGSLQPWRPKIVALSASSAETEQSSSPENMYDLFVGWMTKPVTADTMRRVLESNLAGGRTVGGNAQQGVQHRTRRHSVCVGTGGVPSSFAH